MFLTTIPKVSPAHQAGLDHTLHALAYVPPQRHAQPLYTGSHRCIYQTKSTCIHSPPSAKTHVHTYVPHIHVHLCTATNYDHTHAPPESFTHIGSHICMHMYTNVSSTSTHIYTSTPIHTPHTPRNTCIHTALMSLTYLTQRATLAMPAQQHPSSKEFTTVVHLELPSLLIAGCLWSHLCLSLVSGLC